MLRELFAGALVALMVPGTLSSASAQSEDSLPYGNWTVDAIHDARTSNDAQMTLDLARDGTLSGSGGCNNYTSQASIREGRLEFEPIGATRMMCSSAVMKQEQRFFEALELVNDWHIAGEELRLLDEEGHVAISLVPTDPQQKIVIPVPRAETVDSSVVTYLCEGQTVSVEYINAGAVSLALLSFDNERVVASNVISASGAKYAGGRYVWWSKSGTEASLTDVTKEEGTSPVSCTALQ